MKHFHFYENPYCIEWFTFLEWQNYGLSNNEENSNRSKWTKSPSHASARAAGLNGVVKMDKTFFYYMCFIWSSTFSWTYGWSKKILKKSGAQDYLYFILHHRYVFLSSSSLFLLPLPYSLRGSAAGFDWRIACVFFLHFWWIKIIMYSHSMYSVQESVAFVLAEVLFPSLKTSKLWSECFWCATEWFNLALLKTPLFQGVCNSLFCSHIQTTIHSEETKGNIQIKFQVCVFF